MKKSLLIVFASILLGFQSALAHNPDKVYDAAAERFYNVPAKHVAAVNERGLAHDELPAVLYISELSRTLPERIADLRKEGKSWGWIMDTFNVGPDALYVPISGQVTKPPFDRLYGYFKSKQKSEWRSIKLSDAEVIDLINLRFLAKYFKIKPETVITKRELGDGYVDICHYFATPVKKRKKKPAPTVVPEAAQPPAVPDTQAQQVPDQAPAQPDTSGMAMPPAGVDGGPGMVPPDPVDPGAAPSAPAAEAAAPEGAPAAPAAE